MAITIEKFNIIPNFKYYIKFSASGDNILVEVFNTAADLVADINRVAYCDDIEAGANVEITLEDDTTLPVIKNRNVDEPWHLTATMTTDNLPLSFEFGPYFVLTVNDSLVSTDIMQEDRANFEINKGSHAAVNKQLKAPHDASRAVGDVVDLSVQEKEGEKNRRLKLEQRYNFNEGKPTLIDTVTLESYQNLAI